ncbi:DinB family protein [Flammeovirga sp. SJP92]|uniref:DinB family protein n=1 Tax=Flammeovirga sp. SJP92 TaxID=1775430 RepID=UPI0007870FD2|nr:DinB family protein [Flammeovirga sp. SJP92]KXX68971.1 hypothetical protein AVL50_17575 [Flammeovirga sp. SJP92]
MKNKELEHLLQKYFKAPQQLKEKLKSIDTNQLSFKSSERSWSVREVIIHLADSEVNAFLRYRTIIAEPFRETYVVDEWKWSQELKYQVQDITHYLDLFESLRLITYHQLLLCTDADWDKYVKHSYLGEITLKKWLKIYVEHFEQHMKQIDKVLSQTTFDVK